MTDSELNINIKAAPYDKLVKYTLLWMFPKTVRPNHITVFRFLASPIVFWFFLTQEYVWGFWVFLAVALTDAIDGAMARTRSQITIWGTVYDGVADKFLIGGAMLVLVMQNLSVWMAALIIIIEALTIAGAIYFKRRGIIHQANWYGKVKMNLQVLGTALLLIGLILNRQFFFSASMWVFAFAVIFALASMSAHIKLTLPRH